MATAHRVLDPEPVLTLEDYRKNGGGRGLEAARKLGAVGIIEELEASGLRGRGGAGFPTGRKWRTVAENTSPTVPATIVVNASEGEPGSFKDRAILRANPFRVLEGALIAAYALAADEIVLALKASFHPELGRVREAIEAIEQAGWADGLTFTVVEGPGEYLYGEETALLEVVNGRAPFPRIAPPYREGADVVAVDPGGDTGSASEVSMAGPGQNTPAPPALVNNTETLANVPLILADGPAWFRSVGTDDSPGTVVCTVSGHTRRHAVGEFPMGTPLRQVLDELGGGPESGGEIVAVMSGVANALVPAADLDTPVSYEDMAAIGTGLGAAGFIVFDDRTDLAAVARGVSRFLSVESCGQCTPCKQDGLAMAEILDRVCRSEAEGHDLDALADRVATVADEARCFLATQHQVVIGSVLKLFPEALAAHVDVAVDKVGRKDGGRPAVEEELIVPILDLRDGRAVLALNHREKQPDWTYDEVPSGQSPADRIDQRKAETV